MTKLSDAIDLHSENLVKQAENLALLRGIIAELRLPHTLDDFEVSWLYVSERSSYFAVHLSLLANDDGTERTALLAFGTIKKVRDAMLEAGWSVGDGLNLTAASWGKKMKAALNGHRGEARLDFEFMQLPEGPHCRLVEETIDVPASTKKVLRVVCEEPGLAIEQPALASPALEVVKA